MRFIPAIALAASLIAMALACACAAGDVTVFAAASLTNAFGEIGALYLAKERTLVKFSFAASSTLARQIEAGADADIFASADEEWMDYLAKRHLVIAATRISPLSNRLVLVASADSKLKADIRPNFDLARLLGDGRLATGDPAHVPVGRYAQQALTALGVWNVAEPRLARAENVRAALALVERGEAPLGIVYATDAAIAKRVKVVGIFPAESHPPVRYPFAILSGRDRPEVKSFFAFLTSDEARRVYRKYGFTLQ